MSDIRMPKPSTIRRCISTTLSDEKIIEIMEWLSFYSGRQFVKPNNQILRALITWEEAKTKRGI